VDKMKPTRSAQSVNKLSFEAFEIRSFIFSDLSCPPSPF
jgi:hypothetical protein